MSNKTISSYNCISLAFLFIGYLIGAGFLSGQELWQFYGIYGKSGAVFLVLSGALQGLLGYFVVAYSKKFSVNDFKNLLLKDNKIYKFTIVFTELLFIFFIFSIMIAGVNSLYYSMFLKDGVWFSLLFTIAVSLVSYYGVDVIVKMFNVILPIIIIITAIIFVIVVANYGYKDAFSLQNVQNIALNNPFSSSILYIAHNIYLVLILIVPTSERISKKSVAKKGFFTSSIIFIAVSLFVVVPIFLMPDYAKFSMPLLEIIKDVSFPLYCVFSLLLMLVMFSTAVSSTVLIVDYSLKKSTFFNKNKLIFCIVLGVTCYGVSFMGFSSLIAIMYPLSGVLGIVVLVVMAINFAKIKIK